MSTLVDGDLLAAPQRLADVRRVVFDETDFFAVEQLRSASALFRRLTFQTISLVEDDTQELQATYGDELWLPQRPVISVSELLVRYQGETEFAEFVDFTFTRRGRLHQYAWETPWYTDKAIVHVTYTHGYEIIPEDVQTVVLAWAARLYEQGAAGGLVASKTIGSYSYTNATAADGVPVGMTAFESDVVEAYKPKDA